ncbi:C40 family peptidase [Kytococcus sp. Marseille-QA3725]
MSATTFETPAVVNRRSLLVGSAAAAGAGALTVGSATGASAMTQSRRRSIYRKARTQEGKPYVYGADGPSSYDCSGLVQWAHKAYGVSLPRSAASQYRAARKISRRYATLGDMLFVGDWNYASHVGFYVPWNGRHYIYHAPRPGRRLSCDRIWTWRYTTRRFG